MEKGGRIRERGRRGRELGEGREWGEGVGGGGGDRSEPWSCMAQILSFGSIGNTFHAFYRKHSLYML